MEAFARAGILTANMQLGGFIFAYLLQTETFYDIFGGLNFLGIALLGLKQDGILASSDRFRTMSVLFIASRLWLLMFLAWRAHHRKGDTRFDGVKDKFGMFLVYWLVQALWCFIISLPLLVVQSAEELSIGQPSKMSWIDHVSAVGFATGIAFEIIADIQKARWVAAGRQGGFCRLGLWKYSRHPNYFGEMLMWWCAWTLSHGAVTQSPDLWWTWVTASSSPIFTMYILLIIEGTGISHAEGGGLKRYYESDFASHYDEYRRKTSPLIPWVGYEYLPSFVQKFFFFEWDRYKYRPKVKGG